MKINENQWKSININKKQWKSININEHRKKQWKSIKIIKNKWQSMKIIKKQWKSSKNHENQFMKINSWNQWNSIKSSKIDTNHKTFRKSIKINKNINNLYSKILQIQYKMNEKNNYDCIEIITFWSCTLRILYIRNANYKTKRWILRFKNVKLR